MHASGQADRQPTNPPTNVFFFNLVSLLIFVTLLQKNISSESGRGRDAGRICSTTPIAGALSNRVPTFLLLSFPDPPSLLVCLVEKED